jgi:hypothetical protein
MKFFLKVLYMIGRFARFCYFWLLLLLSVEITFRLVGLNQKMYQLPIYWAWVALAINVVLIAVFLRDIFYSRRRASKN